MKLPFTFALKFLLRMIFPGFVISLALAPALHTLVAGLYPNVNQGYLFVVQIILCGWIILIMDMPIYMVYEGRRFWPEKLKRAFTRREAKRCQFLLECVRKYHKSDMHKYLRSSTLIRMFPINENGEYEAYYPTRLGNLIEAYERYPNMIYGINRSFWWRIWLKLDKDTREEIDNQQAVADSALYVSFSLWIASAICAIYLVVSVLFPSAEILYIPRLDDQGIFYLVVAAVPFALAALAFALYRLSIYIHAQFGEIFKSIFDQFHSDAYVGDAFNEICKKMGNAYPARKKSVKEKNAMIWNYLQNYKIRSPWTQENVPVPKWDEHRTKHEAREKEGDRRHSDTACCEGTVTVVDHPRVFLSYKNGVAVCPYCRRRFNQ